MILLGEAPGVVKPPGTGSRLAGAGDWGGNGVSLMGAEFRFCKMRKFWRWWWGWDNNVNGLTVHSGTLNRTLKNG